LGGVMLSNQEALPITGLQFRTVPTLLAHEQKKALFFLFIDFMRPLFIECAAVA
jgi:hypothetical protein